MLISLIINLFTRNPARFPLLAGLLSVHLERKMLALLFTYVHNASPTIHS